MTRRTRHVDSTGGVRVAVHRLGATTGEQPRLLISHATGFHGRCYGPLVAELAATGGDPTADALDYRGHGDTTLPAGMPISWDAFADDALAVAADIAGRRAGRSDGASRPLVGFGHSMGGACLLAAAARQPDRFAALVVYEPIVFPPTMAAGEHGSNPLVSGARRRRRSFPSYADALDNFAAKRPLGRFRADALEAYVHDGFRPVDDGVTLKCTPEVEAETFEAASEHRIWDQLPSITTPVIVLGGRRDGSPPPEVAEPVAERLPTATFRRLEHLDHFGPMTHPDEIARLLLDAFGPG